jgi:hypothetical protein
MMAQNLVLCCDFQSKLGGVSVIERLKETAGAAFGFKVAGTLSEEDVKAFEPQLEFFIAQQKKHPIGILTDLTEMHGAEWKARWEDLRFLQKHTDHIARMAVVGAHRWEEIVGHFNRGSCRSAVRDALLRIL